MAGSALLLSTALPSLTCSTHTATSSRRRLTAALPHQHQLLSFKPLQKPYALHKPFTGLEPFRSRNVVVNAIFGRKKTAPKAVRETVIPEPDYRVALVLLGAAGALVYSDNLLPAAPIGLLGLLLLVQTTRVRFVFDDEGLEVKIGKELDESEENVFVGGKNRWSYSSFVNWELWWPNFPVLVYFKETQTKPEGQIHFFPVIFNGKQLYDVMVERAGPSKTSGPKQ
ncbi:hypothetical protein KC19_8G058400 [Ceratodon purpureus]|uniref:DUF3119 family protein n=1 Tax=Ceratodon purpureus TaxID=3225 RepID=A0A8T0H146_CERPU|nr:hypothetical protein KC19_8G058400 [Ceratodon purpureus]